MTGATLDARESEARTSNICSKAPTGAFRFCRRAYEAVQKIALDDLGLNVFPNQIEVISAEQMLDAYSSVGMPLMYSHWSYGKRFVRDELLYRKGYQALAYEIVINSNPCISYYMEENTMAMQTLVLAHAAFGHNHFFKNNYLFQQWTDPNGHSRLSRIRQAICRECEERHGVAAVESVLDAAHALMNQGVFRYRRASKLKLGEYESAPPRATGERSARSTAISGAPCRVPRSRSEPTLSEQEAVERKQRSAPARGEPAVFPGEEQPRSARLAARAAPHRAQRRAIFLPAAADQVDERGLRDLRPLSHRQPAVRRRPDLRRRAAGDPAQPLQRRLSDRLRQSASSAASTRTRWASR